MKPSTLNSQVNVKTPTQLAPTQGFYPNGVYTDNSQFGYGNTVNESERDIQYSPYSNAGPTELETLESLLQKRKLELEEKLKALTQLESSTISDHDRNNLKVQNRISSNPMQNIYSPSHAALYTEMNNYSRSEFNDRNSTHGQNFSSQLQSPTGNLFNIPTASSRSTSFHQLADPKHQNNSNHQGLAIQKSLEIDAKRKYKEELDNQLHEKQKQKELESEAQKRKFGTKMNQNQHQENGLEGNFDRKKFPVVSASSQSNVYSNPGYNELPTELSEERAIPKRQTPYIGIPQEDEEIRRKREKQQKQQIAEDLRRQIQEKEEKKKLEKKRLLEEEQREIEKLERQQREAQKKNQNQNPTKNAIKSENRNDTYSVHKSDASGIRYPSHLSSPQHYQAPNPQTPQRKTDGSSVLSSHSSNQAIPQHPQFPHMQPPYPFFNPENWSQFQNASGAQMFPTPYWPYPYPFFYPPQNFSGFYPTPTQQDLNRFKEFLQEIQEKAKKEDKSGGTRSSLYRNKLIRNQKENIQSNNQPENLGYSKLSNSKFNNFFPESSEMLHQSNQSFLRNYGGLTNKSKPDYFEEQSRSQSQNEESSQFQNRSLTHSDREHKFLSRALLNEFPLKKEKISNQNYPITRMLNDNDLSSLKSPVAESHISNQSHLQAERSFFKDLEAFKESQKHFDSINPGFSSEDHSLSLSESEGIHHRNDPKKLNRFEFPPVIEVGLEETPTQTTNFNQLLGTNLGEKPSVGQARNIALDDRRENDLKGQNENITIITNQSENREVLPFENQLKKEDFIAATHIENPNPLLDEIHLDQGFDQIPTSKSSKQQPEHLVSLKSQNIHLYTDHHMIFPSNSKTQDSQYLETTQSEISRLDIPEKEPIEIIMRLENSRYQKEINITEIKSERSVFIPEANNAVEIRLADAQSERSLIIADEEEYEDEEAIDEPNKSEVMKQNSSNIGYQETSYISMKSKKDEIMNESLKVSAKLGEQIAQVQYLNMYEDIKKSTHLTSNEHRGEENLSQVRADGDADSSIFQLQLRELVESNKREKHLESIKAVKEEEKSINHPPEMASEKQADVAELNALETNNNCEEKETTKPNLRDSDLYQSLAKKTENKDASSMKNERNLMEEAVNSPTTHKEVETDVSREIPITENAKLHDSHYKIPDEKVVTSFQGQASNEEQTPLSTIENQISASGLSSREHLASGISSKIKGVSEKATTHLVRKQDSDKTPVSDSSAISRLGLLHRIRFQKKSNISNSEQATQIDNSTHQINVKPELNMSKDPKSESVLLETKPEMQLEPKVHPQRGIEEVPIEQQSAKDSLTKKSEESPKQDAQETHNDNKQEVHSLSDTVAYPDDFSSRDTQFQNSEPQLPDDNAKEVSIERPRSQQTRHCELPMVYNQDQYTRSKQDTSTDKIIQIQSNSSHITDNPSMHDQSYSSSNLGERNKNRKIKTLDPFSKAKSSVERESFSSTKKSQGSEILSSQVHHHSPPNGLGTLEMQQYRSNKERSQMILDRLMNLLGNIGEELVIDTQSDLPDTEREESALDQTN